MIALFGPHAGFIAASYAVAIVLIGGLGFWTIRDHKIMSRKLAQIDPRLTDDKKPPNSTSVHIS